MYWSGSGNMHSAAGNVDDEQRVVGHEATRSPDLGGEEVGGADHIRMRAEESPP